ncbi:MAG TPA: hemolysin family protein, partial [Candidatus Kapabacteria bacterium]|nr:hemolysin family protein [Candidatus Kapabacteria bacterium]
MILDILITLFLVLLNGFFVAAEFAIVKVRLSQIELIARAGNPFAPMAKKIVEHLDAYLSATQLGITLASLGLGWVGEPVVAKAIGEMLHAFGMRLDPDTLHKIAVPIAFAIITVLHIVLGELAPKSLAIQRPETVTLATSIPLRFFYIVFKPFIWSLNSIANRLLKLIGIEPGLEQELHSAEEIRYLIEESSKGGIMEISETELISNVFDFGETTASSIMVPRGNMCAIDIGLSGEQMFAKVLEEGYSRMPVY